MFACTATTGRADRRIPRHRKLPAAERTRHTRRVRIAIGIESIAAALRLRRSRLLDDGRRLLGIVGGLLIRGRLLPLIDRRTLRLTIGLIGLGWRHGGRVGLDGDRGLTGRRTALKLPELLFEQLVAMLQFFVLAGQLP